ncbi:hypothetical protein [Kordia jejudonensis]|uniref:hypothetical protein n=1 Tax=Kordia jejudonensis TaxID=1348245 RepID=UPI0006291410|nr:hypothetical protein [Kordia jejudonensis]
MKKKNLKSLRLNKKLVSNLSDEVTGGAASGNMLCVTNGCPTNTLIAACSNHMCDSRLGGCPSYYYCAPAQQAPMEPSGFDARVDTPL